MFETLILGIFAVIFFLMFFAWEGYQAVKQEQARIMNSKVTSPRVAEIAARVMREDAVTPSEIRSLAASALAQSRGDDDMSGIEDDRETIAVGIELMCAMVHETAINKGWYDPNMPREFGTCIALIHSELSEALEVMRTGDVTTPDDNLPELSAVGVELADVLIRIADLCEANQINLAQCIVGKMQYNDSRADRHGGKNF